MNGILNENVIVKEYEFDNPLIQNIKMNYYYNCTYVQIYILI